MGLCKCPKRKVTNQFCYEHRVNVCESCMITNHPKCVVLSYLKWLQDGDYNPVCELCSEKLVEGECIRLVCYHVFHWHCLDHYARQMPDTIAPAGFMCPSCKFPIFPSPNLVSPVADVLRKKFENVNWARVGLGLPLLPEEEDARNKNFLDQNWIQKNNPYLDGAEQKSSNIIVQIESQINDRYKNVDVYESKFPDNVPRRLTHSTDAKKLIDKFEDHDDNKYERRTMTEKLGRLHKYASKSKYFQFYFRHKYRRIFIVAVFLFIGFFVFMLILDKLGDSVFDPLSNPSGIVDNY